MLVFWPELRDFSLTSDRWLGLGLALGGTISASLGNIISARNQRHTLPVIQTNMYGMAYGALFMFLLALTRGAQFEFETTIAYSLSLAYLALFGSVIAFGSYLTLLGRIGAQRAGYAAVMFPIVAFVLSALFEDLAVTSHLLIGTAVALLGNALILARGKRPAAPASDQPAVAKRGGRPALSRT
jgi:drug/metabolite transporter (DMT)-like permease